MEIKIQNKKGMFFTILAITLLSLFALSYSLYSITQNRESITKRIETMNNFVHLVEEDLPRQLYISGFRIIFLLEKKITETGQYITDLNSTFKECFYNGTIYGESQELMNGVTYLGIIQSLNEKASKINVNFSMTNPNIEIDQVDPWNVRLNFSSELFIKDQGGLVLWNRTYTKEVYIPIDNFEDPLYLINTNGLVTNEINKTPYEIFAIGSDVSNLKDHLKNSYYKASTSAPSFLNRLEGKNLPNENGIESLVYLPKLSAQGISIKEKSVVDYIYFSDNNPTSYQIQGMPNWFRLDEAHLDDYNVDGLIV